MSERLTNSSAGEDAAQGRWRSGRLPQLGSSIFAEVAGWKAEALRKGLDLIDLGIGSPDRPPTDSVRETLAAAALRTDAYGYPSSAGSIAFRRQAAEWMRRRFGVTVDPERELLTLMGSQDGLAHLALAVTDPGDVALVPDPGYPIYAASLALAGVTPYFLPLRADNGFLPDLDAVPGNIWRKAKFMLLNFPANPVAATADLTFFERAAALARKHGVLIVHDLAYSEMGFDGYRPPSILEVPGAADIAVEFHSLSKSFNMAGCRIGFLAGNAEAVGALKELKANIDYGVFEAVQEAGIAALKEGIAALEAGRPGVSEIYERRRNAFLRQLRAEGWDVPAPKATMFVWAPLPFCGEETGDRRTSRVIAKEMLEETGVAVIPGDAFGREGEGYVRIALVEEPERLAEAARRIGAFIRNRAR